MVIKKFIPIILLSIFLSACSLMNTPKDDQNLDLNQPVTISPSSNQSSSANQSTTDQKDQVVALNTDYGQIVLKLFPDQAPNTVKNFISKVNSGFYDGLTFHRVEPGFVVQGGDPKGDGTGGGQIASEINQIPFTVGSVGLARGGDIKVSNDSQFFICLSQEQCQHLSNQYVNFGTVMSGMDAVAQIKPGDSIISATTTTK